MRINIGLLSTEAQPPQREGASGRWHYRFHNFPHMCTGRLVLIGQHGWFMMASTNGVAACE